MGSVRNRVTKVTIRIKEVRWLTPRGAGSNPVRDMVIEMRIRADGIGPRASSPNHLLPQLGSLLTMTPCPTETLVVLYRIIPRRRTLTKKLEYSSVDSTIHPMSFTIKYRKLSFPVDGYLSPEDRCHGEDPTINIINIRTLLNKKN